MSDAVNRARGELQSLAASYSIQSSYKDLDEREVAARPESMVAALRAMRVIDTERDITDALRRKRLADWDWSLSPVTLAWDGRVRYLSLRVPQSTLNSTAECRIDLEEGEPVTWASALSQAQVMEEAGIEGRHFAEARIAVSATLPPGYHRLRVDVAGHRLESLVISAPKVAYRAPERRSWGVFMPLYALHSGRSWGIGDYTDLRRLIEWAGAQGAHFAGTLPLLPAFLDKPYAPSPYQPVSRLFWNEVYADVEAPLPDGTMPEIEGGLAEKGRKLTDFEEVPYRAVMSLKRQALASQAAQAGASASTAGALAAFLDEKPPVREYARFRATVEKLGPAWREWPEEARWGNPGSADYEADTARLYEFAQWRADHQMQEVAEAARRAGVRLYLDLPVGVHRDGFDTWRYRDLFAEGMSVGSPPDLLSSNGQDWGFQPMIPEALRTSGYEYHIAHLQHVLSLARMLRVDHAIGLHRLYWIPDGATGRDGVFVRQPAEELYAVLCLESHRQEAVLIGENLGLVPPEVDEGLREHGLSGMYVQMFQMTADKKQPLEPVPEASVASFSTHDLPPFAAYWEDDDLRERLDMGLLTPPRVDEEIEGRKQQRMALLAHLKDRGLVSESPGVLEVYRGSTALLAESVTDWLLINLEETWGETRSQNLPGTRDDEHANWVRRAAHSLDEFESLDELSEAVSTVRRHRQAGSSANQEGG